LRLQQSDTNHVSAITRYQPRHRGSQWHLWVCGPDFLLQDLRNLTLHRSISIACWVVVFSPQIIENFRRSSADGLSIVFLVVWLLGDLFNIVGAVLQGVLPTMIILALYYTLADIVLVGQVFYYRGFTLSDKIGKADEGPGEEEPLLARCDSGVISPHIPGHDQRPRRMSLSELGRSLSNVDGTHLSPATPLLDAPKSNEAPAATNLRPTTTFQPFVSNTFSILLVCGAGVLGWWIGQHSKRGRQTEDETSSAPEFDTLGQVFGYLCAVFYLGSRVPQLLLNFRRKSTEGVSLLFFLFACIGNLTYVMSIFAYSPICESPGHCEPGEAGYIYGRYIMVNLSWIAGSAGTLFLDLAIFWQFFLYKKDDDDLDEESSAAETRHDRRAEQANT
jgi:solute carrier family 66 (lysosomal lysine-arginine transporter), member 1